MCHIIQMETTSTAFGNCKDQLYIARQVWITSKIPCFHAQLRLKVVVGHGSWVSGTDIVVRFRNSWNKPWHLQSTVHHQAVKMHMLLTKWSIQDLYIRIWFEPFCIQKCANLFTSSLWIPHLLIDFQPFSLIDVGLQILYDVEISDIQLVNWTQFQENVC